MALFSADNQPASRFFERVPEDRRCDKIARSGTRCRKVALNGCSRCGSHGGFWQRWRKGGAYPASMVAGRQMKRVARQALDRYGRPDLADDWRWRASSAERRAIILAGLIVSQADNDPGVLQRALEVVEGELQWITRV